MNMLSLVIPALFYPLVVGLCAYLLIRGVTHLFIGLFAAGALLHMLQTMAYIIMSRLPGGFGAYQQYLPILAILGALGTILFGAAFIAMTSYLLGRPADEA